MSHPVPGRPWAPLALAVVLALGVGSAGLFAQNAPAEASSGAPVLNTAAVADVGSGVLADAATGRIFWQKRPDEPWVPASLTKLVTSYLALERLETGEQNWDDFVPVGAATEAAALPRDSSLMFLEAGHRVRYGELLQGLAVASGNDAALTLATYLAGSEPAFTSLMNRRMAELGYDAFHFEDSHGYSPQNRITARQMALFSRQYLSRFPQALGLHSLTEMTYPLPANLPAGFRSRWGGIRQFNRNTLLGVYPGLDGLKTGFVEAAGYNLAATAQRGDFRLIAVVLGLPGANTRAGSEARNRAAAALLDWGFATFRPTALPQPALPSPRAWYTEADTLNLRPATSPVWPLSAAERDRVGVRVEAPAEVQGPWRAGQIWGRLVYALDQEPFFTVDLVAATDSQPAPWWKAAWQALSLWWRSLWGQAAPQTAP